MAAYSYLGRGTIVIEDYAEPEVKLDYFGGTSGSYSGFDSFGRVVDQLWTDYGADPDAAIDEYTYGYDRVGNRLWKENVVAGDLGTPVHLDELYAYDELYRLVGTQRGNLNGTADGIVSGTENFEQAWDLDGLGNWAEFDEDADGDGTWDLEQDRAVNSSGEITGVTEEQGQTAWVTPAYDAAGNMTTIPLPSDPTVAQTAVYDAWNRLVEVKQATDTVAVYEYDGLGRRVVRGVDTASPGDPDGTLDTFEHFLYGGVNVVETRDATVADAQTESLQPHYQYVWSARYVDAPVLRDENTDTDDTCDDGRVYYLTDALGNVTALVSDTGVVLERYVYDPYGQVTIYDDDWSDTRSASSYDNTRLYTGRELDPTTGLYYYRARWYDTGTGNFTTRDPLGFAAGDANLYRYVGNRPVGSTDPSGLWEESGSGGFQGTWARFGVDMANLVLDLFEKGEPVIVVIYDATDSLHMPRGQRSDGKATGEEFRREAQRVASRGCAIGVFNAVTGEGLRAQVFPELQRLRDEGRIISELHIYDHNAPLSGSDKIVQVMGNSLGITPSSTFWQELTAFVDKEGLVVLGGCNIGKDEDYVQEYADSADRIVRAAKGTTKWGETKLYCEEGWIVRPPTGQKPQVPSTPVRGGPTFTPGGAGFPSRFR